MKRLIRISLVISTLLLLSVSPLQAQMDMDSQFIEE